mgnify:CR=1 FL=1|tara:strand:- start:33 stop:710 length:678 start_codon:yes stop_codon:yes gene_type:complete
MNKFDWKYYIKKYPDLRDKGINSRIKALQHYKNYGSIEKRFANELQENKKTIEIQKKNNKISILEEKISNSSSKNNLSFFNNINNHLESNLKSYNDNKNDISNLSYSDDNKLDNINLFNFNFIKNEINELKSEINSLKCNFLELKNYINNNSKINKDNLSFKDTYTDNEEDLSFKDTNINEENMLLNDNNIDDNFKNNSDQSEKIISSDENICDNESDSTIIYSN